MRVTNSDILKRVSREELVQLYEKSGSKVAVRLLFELIIYIANLQDRIEQLERNHESNNRRK